VGEGFGRAGGGHVNGLLEGLQWLVDPANWSGVDAVPARVWEHVQLSLISLAVATLISVPLGLWIGHTRRGQFWTVQLANLGRSIPSLAVLSIAFLLVVKLAPADHQQLAFGFLPTIVALTLLGIPVILINTYVGVQQVDPDTVEAARGMGMNGRQVLWRLEVPLAMPLIMTGLRLAAVQIVATAGLAALIAGGGLGRYVVDGFAQRENDRIVAGAILIAILSLLTDAVFSLLAKAAAPRLTSSGRAIAPARIDVARGEVTPPT
jgi:osmoprotectant transport system permease protein